MQKKVITKVIKVDEITKNKMISFFEDKKRIKTPNYAIFQADIGDTVVTLYNSGKAVFQGVNANMDASMWSAISNGNLDELIEDNKKTKKVEEVNLPININSIGSDEVGTGDYFGPIVVCATYVSIDNIEFLEELGVKDSKKISDEVILKIVPKIIKKIPYEAIILSNQEYNKNYGSNMNMNKIKAILHNKVLTKIISKDFEYDYIVIDQFEPKNAFYRHIDEAANKIQNVTFITKAEDKCLSVACASLISRYIFIKEMDKLGDKYNLFLPKGANSYVDDIGIKIVNKYGEKVLNDIAKLNFSNTNRILKFK